VAGTISSCINLALTCRDPYRFENPCVTGASAKIAGKPIAESVIAGMRIALQQIASRYDHPGGADATLRSATRNECLLQMSGN
jgi:hypothetical protein